MSLRNLLPFAVVIFAVISLSHAEEKADWAGFGGPGGNFVYEDGKRFTGAQPQPIWKSKEMIPSGRVRDARRAGQDASKNSGHAGGYSSPVYADGKIYLFLYRPSGFNFDKPSLEKMGLTAEAAAKLAKQKDPKGNSPIVSEPNKWAIEADDIILCLDAKTGKTLWKKVYEKAGMNWNMFSKGGPYNTPAVHDGKVYAVGTTGNLYCLDAKTGEEIWKGDIGPRAKQQQGYKATALKTGFCTRFNRDFLGNVVATNGVVVVSDYAKHKIMEESGKWQYFYENPGGLIAFEAKTGKKLWHHVGVCRGITPVIWQHKGKSYAIAVGHKGVKCIDVKTGRVQWTLREGNNNQATARPIAIGEYLFIFPSIGEKDRQPLTCYQISPKGAKKLWQHTNKETRVLRSNFVVYQDHVYIPMKNAAQLICVEIKTGKTVGTANFPIFKARSGNPFLLIYNGRLIYCAGDEDHKFMTLAANPKNFGKDLKTFNVTSSIGYMIAVLPTFHNGVMYLRSDDRIIAYRMR